MPRTPDTAADQNAADHFAAGDFSAWIIGMQAALRGEHDSDVPCGTCTGCCTSSQFVHIAPDETDTLAYIPSALLFPAPRMPRGNVLLGYDERGHCPMLVDDTCSIYAHRPRTCRTYDCRVFAAAGVELDEGVKVHIAQRASRWQFSHPTADDEVRHDAVRAAAVYLRDRRTEGEGRVLATAATALAVSAVKVHGAFVRHDIETDQLIAVDPDAASVQAALTAAQLDKG
jgi:Fe-S-cluster containining protein